MWEKVPSVSMAGLPAAPKMFLCAVASERPASGKDGRLANLSMIALCQCFARRRNWRESVV
jgi:hypothetical protein